MDAIDFQKLLTLPCAVSQDASGLSQSNQLQPKLAPGKFSTRSDDMPSLLGLATLATAAPSKKPESEVGLEEERTLKRPRARELAEEQAATNQGSVQPLHDGHQAAVQSAVQTPLDDVPPVQDAVHGAGSRGQDSSAGFEPKLMERTWMKAIFFCIDSDHNGARVTEAEALSLLEHWNCSGSRSKASDC